MTHRTKTETLAVKLDQCTQWGALWVREGDGGAAGHINTGAKGR